MRGLVQCLRPEYRQVSVALGALASGCDTATANAYYCPEASGALGALARAVLFARDLAMARPRVARSKSVAMSYVSPGLAGELLGLALKGDREARPALDRHGVLSNSVAGRWTGVSRARFEKLAAALREALESEETTALNVWLRAVWELSSSRRDVLDFYEGLERVGISVLRSDVTQQQLLREDKTSDKVPLSVDDAVSRLLASSSSCQFADDVERAVVALGACVARRPRKIQTVAFGSAPPKPDCVEVCIREVVDFIENKQGAEADEEVSAEEWFAKCQAAIGKDEARLEFLSKDSESGAAYELAPSKRNVALVASRLLFGTRGPLCETFADLALYFNERNQGNRLLVVDRSTAYLPRFSESLQVREVLDFTMEGSSSETTLEIHLERHPAIALATYRSALGLSDAVAGPHLEAFFTSQALLEKERRPVLRSLWLSAIFGDRALEDERLLRVSSSEEDRLLGLLAARFGAHDVGRWSPLTSDGLRSNEAHDHAASLKVQELRHVRRSERASLVLASLLEKEGTGPTARQVAV